MNTRSGPSDTALNGPAWWLAALFLLIALFAQVEVLHYLSWRDAQLSVVLVVVVWYALHADWRRAAFFGAIAGLCEDAFGAMTGGAWTISTTLTAVLANCLTRWLFADDSIPVAAAIVFAASLLRRMLFWTVMALQGYPSGYAQLHFHQAVWTALMNAAFIIIALLVWRRIEQRRLQ